MTSTKKAAVDVSIAVPLAQAPGGSVLFIDTCAYLDIRRLAQNETRSFAYTLKKVIAVRDAVRAGALLAFSAATVQEEYDRNASDVRLKAKEHQQATDEAVKRFLAAAQQLPVGHTAADPEIMKLDIITRLCDLADELIAGTTFIAESPASHTRASQRISRNHRPAQRGKGHADCLIAETLLDFTGSAQWRTVFLTTNTHDYSDEKSKKVVHQHLATDFTSNDIVTAFDWISATKELGL